MNKLWAPWRKRYIFHPKMKGCIFCSEPKRNSLSNNLILVRGTRVFSILNLFPYNNGHVMIAPYRHLKTPAELTAQEAAEIHEMLKTTIRLIEKVLKPDGFNIGMNVGRVAGAGYDKHIHLHVVPRWDGDTNFMPVIAQEKVVSQSLAELKKSLLKASRQIRTGK